MGRPLLLRPNCKICDRPVARTKSVVCSKECAAKSLSQARNKQIPLNCEYCRAEFWVKPSRLTATRSPVRFCSNSCKNSFAVKNHTFVCSKCGEQKELNDFFVDNMKKRGHVARCKACYAAARRAKIDAKATVARPEHCDICGGRVRVAVFDHCHATGRFRGWLCDRCNLTLGKVNDDPGLLKKMIAYLMDANSAITHNGRY